MPELPEVEVTRRSFADRIRGARILAARAGLPLRWPLGLAPEAAARQPVWLERAGRSAWAKVQPWVSAPGGSLAAGFAWALMPCGLLYSAVLVAALSGGAWQGGLSMAAFALGSGVWLVGGPWLWRLSQSKVNVLRAQWGTRIAGLMLIGVAIWALWMDLVYKPSLWCR